MEVIISNKNRLTGPLFGPFSFINIFCGKEEMDDLQCSRKNIVEVAIVTKIVQNLYKAWKGDREHLSIVVASPYSGQVHEIRDKLGDKYKHFDRFVVKVMQIEELVEGKEGDIVILSTVRSNSTTCSIALPSDHPSIDISSIRARHCLWILGHETSLSESDSVWSSVIEDAKDRKCFHNVEDDKDLFTFVVEVKNELDKLDDFLDADNLLFKSAMWKVLFSENFRTSFDKIESRHKKKLVINLLLRLANGLRPKKRKDDNITCSRSKHVLKQFKVKDRFVIFSVDVVKESLYFQVLRVWDIVPHLDVPKLVDRLDSLFLTYTDDFLDRCKVKHIEGDLVIPVTWQASDDIVRLKELPRHNQGGLEKQRQFSQDSKVSDSLLLTKFYLASSRMASHLLSGCNDREAELPFELTSEEMDIIRFDKSSFVLGRSGTGKTTVIARKIFQKEQLHHIASKGFHGINGHTEDCERVDESDDDVFLRQIFVSLNPGLCCAVNEVVSGLKRFACGVESVNNQSAIQLGYISDVSRCFDEIPDSFEGLTRDLYPLVIPFHKFLIMLDGTLGDSFFNRFPEAGSDCQDNTRTKSEALKTFIRMKEVDFGKFDCSYWPQFSKKLTKNIQSLTVFTEIMSHIKGGLLAWDAHDGKISRKDYVLMSESRVSNLDENQRENVYDIFLQYEMKKRVNGEYDLEDLVADLHRRFREKEHEAVNFDFVYFDEVQDLTMGQIALFKYMCKNVNGGFVFAGDTAQTIAKGVDFRFEDIRHLFYKEFILKSRSNNTIYEKGEKGLIEKISHLSQNFRTHSGVLNLAQSVIDLVYHFFPRSIDFLSPETSLILGETPVLVEYLNKTEFTSMLSRSSLGADQVILVRDESIKREISSYAGNRAIVLTIFESKGLEFRDVLLYNFLSSSAAKDQWNLVYTYMKEKDLLHHNHRPLPSFDGEKHRLLCSELKQLYVAITRTKQRLWILEMGEGDGLSGQMCEYWRTLKVVEDRGFDPLFFSKTQITSTKEQWKSTGLKFFSEKNYDAAKICFRRAGESILESWAKAAGLRAAAWQISSLNSDTSDAYLTEAASIFLSIDQFHEAAQCFCESKQYEVAGTIYMENCGNSKLREAGECFTRAKLYNRAAFAYSKANLFSQCLDACLHGKLFAEGLEYIPCWRRHATANKYMKMDEGKINAVEQKLLEISARGCKKRGDEAAMMEFVNAFHSEDSKRVFLKAEGCYDELLSLEIRCRNFVNAAKIAKQIGNTLLEVEMLEKAERFRDSSLRLLFHILATSVWQSGSKGWPLKRFQEKNALLHEAEKYAGKVSRDFFKLVWTEKGCLSDRKHGLLDLEKLLNGSQRYQSVGGQIICTWKILDFHFDAECSRYLWQNQVFVERLLLYWENWKQMIGKIFHYLGHLDNLNKYGKFCLSYLGVTVTKHYGTKKPIYLILNPDAIWVKNIHYCYLHREGKTVFCEGGQFAHAARCYWNSEMVSVGTKVLKSLRDFYELSKKNSLPLHCQTLTRLRIYVLAKYLGESKFLHKENHNMVLHDCTELSTDASTGFVFPMFSRELLNSRMTDLRESREFKNLLEDEICQMARTENDLSFLEIGNTAMAVLGASWWLSRGTYDLISERFGSDSVWKCCIQSLGSEDKRSTSSPSLSVAFDSSVVRNLHEALQHTYYADCLGRSDYMLPNCFVYLIEHVQIMTFYLKGRFLSTKSSFLELLINKEWNKNTVFLIEADWQQKFIGALDITAAIITELLCNKDDIMVWIENSTLNSDCHSMLVLRLFVALCLICVNSGKFYDLLFELLGSAEIASQLPREFCDIVSELRPGNLDDEVSILAKAFASIGNSLVVASSEKRGVESEIPEAIFVDSKPTEEKIG